MNDFAPVSAHDLYLVFSGLGGSTLFNAPDLGCPQRPAAGHRPACQLAGCRTRAGQQPTATPVRLKAGRRYVLELSGERQALTVYLRASRSDVYAAGAAHGDGQPLKDRSGASIDLAFALYDRVQSTTPSH